MLACTFGDCRRGQYPAALLRCKFDAPSACCGGVDFAQWESLAITNTPMINEEFEGWKYGPVSEKVRRCFTRDGMYVEDAREISWRNSRKGLPEGGGGMV